MLFSHRVFQKTSLPLKNARLTPAFRAPSTFVRCVFDQYSSWPTLRKIFGRFEPPTTASWAPNRSVSTPVQYLTLYPFASRNRTIGYSALKRKLCGSVPRVVIGRL